MVVGLFFSSIHFLFVFRIFIDDIHNIFLFGVFQITVQRGVSQIDVGERHFLPTNYKNWSMNFCPKSI